MRATFKLFLFFISLRIFFNFGRPSRAVFIILRKQSNICQYAAASHCKEDAMISLTLKKVSLGAPVSIFPLGNAPLKKDSALSIVLLLLDVTTYVDKKDLKKSNEINFNALHFLVHLFFN